MASALGAALGIRLRVLQRLDGGFGRGPMRKQAHPSEQVIDLSRCSTCNGPRHPRSYQQAEPDERITPLRLIGLTLFMLWIWLALGGLVWVVMAAAS